MIPDNACTPRITAAAGTKLAGAFLQGTVKNENYLLPTLSSLLTGVYTPKGFILHVASLRQTFVHCAKFLTAASRRSLGRISIPVWLIILSDQLPIIALVSHYLTNKLIGRRPISKCEPKPALTTYPYGFAALFGISSGFPELSQSSRQVTYVLLTRSPV